MNIDELLPKTVDIICDAYDFYYSGVFLIDDAREFAVLKAGRGEPGRIMIENNHKLAVGGNSMIGACTALNQARISLDVDTEKVWYPNPVLPETRSEMALPLAIGNRVIGAVTVQSVEAAAFSDEDVSSLQAMANQLAIAIDNAASAANSTKPMPNCCAPKPLRPSRRHRRRHPLDWQQSRTYQRLG